MGMRAALHIFIPVFLRYLSVGQGLTYFIVSQGTKRAVVSQHLYVSMVLEEEIWIKGRRTHFPLLSSNDVNLK